MPVHQYRTNRRPPPPQGIIRCGTEADPERGTKMANTTHFVLNEAPSVAAVYGETPAELHVVFPTDDFDTVAPTSWQWWSAAGLNCEGTGMKDVEARLAGEAVMTDPKTRAKCPRPCLGASCQDAFDAKGRPQCTPRMELRFLMPTVSRDGYFVLRSKSEIFIRSVHNLLLDKLEKGLSLSNSLFVLKKTKVDTQYKKGQDVILLEEVHNPAVIAQVKASMNTLPQLDFRRTQPQDLQLQPTITEPLYIGEGGTPATVIEPTDPKIVADKILSSLDVAELVAEFEKVGGKKLPRKDLLLRTMNLLVTNGQDVEATTAAIKGNLSEKLAALRATSVAATTAKAAAELEASGGMI